MANALSHTRCFPLSDNGVTVFYWDNGAVCPDSGHPEHAE